jgi:hypothetical protein
MGIPPRFNSTGNGSRRPAPPCNKVRRLLRQAEQRASMGEGWTTSPGTTNIGFRLTCLLRLVWGPCGRNLVPYPQRQFVVRAAPNRRRLSLQGRLSPITRADGYCHRTHPVAGSLLAWRRTPIKHSSTQLCACASAKPTRFSTVETPTNEACHVDEQARQPSGFGARWLHRCTSIGCSF